ncbi:MFS transporter [Plantibacter sp. Mn2098]|uniref:MFS transporter n=1 Tax=Plantibacter sp. Mn2098 TaxID=3395266 RepID=UPI003BBE7294
MSTRTLPAGVAFGTAAIAFGSVMAAAGAPSPLFVLYQEAWHFPAWQLTLAFSIYAITLLVALLIAGSLSDHVGRRPLLIGSVVVQLVAMAIFIVAPNIEWVIVARALQGIATGAATSTFSAYIVESAPGRFKKLGSLIVSIAPVGGLGLGAVLTGLAVQFSPAPSLIIFSTLFILFLVALVLIILSPETVTPVPGALASLTPRIRVPKAARRDFAAIAPGLVGTWMVASLMLSLGASITHQVFGIQNGAVNGIVIALQPIAASLAILFIAGRLTPRQSMVIGYWVVLGGVALEIGSLVFTSLPLLIVGAIVVGAGFGGTFSGALRTLAPLAASHERAELFAAIYLVSYLSYGVPTIATGFLIGVIGLVDATIIYAAAVFIVTAVGLLSLLVRRRNLPPVTVSVPVQRGQQA